MPAAANDRPPLRLLSFADLPGWRDADHAAALAAFRRSCEVILDRGLVRPARFGGRALDWRGVCLAARGVPPGRRAARRFFERHFLPVSPTPTRRAAGLFTGYYEAEAEGCLRREGDCRWPLHALPDDLVRFTPAERRATGLDYGRRTPAGPRPYFSRREIDEGALDGRGLEIVWLTSLADRFFIQIQGSGRVRLREGGVLRLAFAGKNGRRYVPVGRLLVERGEISREEMSMQAIRRWLAAHPDRARDLLWENPSYVFFRVVRLPDPRLGAFGAHGVQLAPLVSLAVDWRHWPYGAPVWLDTRVPRPDGRGEEPFRRLMVAQDTGSAIRGVVRGDIYFGFGEEAAARAGRMRAPGFMAVLLPRALARRLGR
ncbi:MAG TPA: transglycosylase [Thermopetrobacter sp.]|nr:transglycosylase [Thermopetrobacter sp.]